MNKLNSLYEYLYRSQIRIRDLNACESTPHLLLSPKNLSIRKILEKRILYIHIYSIQYVCKQHPLEGMNQVREYVEKYFQPREVRDEGREGRGKRRLYQVHESNTLAEL